MKRDKALEKGLREHINAKFHSGTPDLMARSLTISPMTRTKSAYTEGWNDHRAHAVEVLEGEAEALAPHPEGPLNTGDLWASAALRAAAEKLRDG